MEQEDRRKIEAQTLVEPTDWLGRSWFFKPTIALPEGYKMKLVQGPKGDHLIVIEPEE